MLEELINQVKDLKREDIEILLIDNNSNDETKAITLEQKEKCNFLTYHFESRQGLAKARNKGIEISKGKVISFIDDDIVLDKNWLKEIILAIEKHSYKAFGGKVIPL